jgi:hypothetical protein
MSRVQVAALSFALSMSGCANGITAPHPPHVIEDETVRVTLAVTPAVLSQGEVAVASLEYKNTTSETVVITSTYGCLAFAAVYRESVLIPFPSTGYGCTTAISHRNIEPGEPLVMEWSLPIGEPDGVAAPPGIYRFVAHLNTHADSLVREFVVR